MRLLRNILQVKLNKPNMKLLKTTTKLLILLFISGNLITAQDGSSAVQLNSPIEQTVETATRTSRLLSEVPIKTEVLGGDAFDLEVRSSLGEAIELLNGARTEANCQNCGAAEIQLLGLPGNYNQILFDGQPLFTGVASVYGIDQVPTIFVDRIEVVKGGASALYGPGAIAGVINILPIEPYDNTGKIEYNYRSIDGAIRKEGQFLQSFVSDSLSIKGSIYGLLSEQDPYDPNKDGFTDLVKSEKKSFGAYLAFNPSEKTEIVVQYQNIKEDRRGGDKLDRKPQFSQVAEMLESDYQWATLKLNQDIDDHLDFSISGSVVKINRDSYYGGTGEVVIDPNLVKVSDQSSSTNGTYNNSSSGDQYDALFGEEGSYNKFGDLESTTYFFDSQINSYIGNGDIGSHVLTLGLQYEYEDIYDINTNAFGAKIGTLHDQNFYNAGFYLQDQWLVSDRAELDPGIRVDKAKTLEDSVISPRIAFRYTLTDEITFRSNFSTGFLAPRIFDEDTHIDTLAGKPIDIVNDPDLKEESSRTFALGFDYSISGFNTSIQSYYTTVKDSFFLEEADTTGTRGVQKRINTDGSTILGLEWDLSWTPSEFLRIDAGIAYTSASYDKKQEVFSGNSVFSDHYNKTPEGSGLVKLTYSTEELGDLSLGLKWTGPMKVNRLTGGTDDAPEGEITESDSFFVLNATLRREFHLGGLHLHGKLGIHNILDDYQKDLEKGVARDVGYVYGPRFPRSLFIGIGLKY